jgi:hypothetical protein
LLDGAQLGSKGSRRGDSLQSPHAGLGARRRTYGAWQPQGEVRFSATGVLSSEHAAGVEDGIAEGLKQHGARSAVREAELRQLAQARWQDRIRGKWRSDPAEWQHYRAGYQTGFQEAWSHQGRTGGGQNLAGALRERARRQLLNKTDAGQQVLKREEQARGR